MVTIVLMLMVNRMTLIMTRMRSMPTVCLRVLGRPLLLATSLSSVKVHLFAKVCLPLLRFFQIALYSVFFPGAECFLFTFPPIFLPMSNPFFRHHVILHPFLPPSSLSLTAPPRPKLRDLHCLLCLSCCSCQPHSLKNFKNKTK